MYGLLGQYLAEIQLFEKSGIWGCNIKILRKSPFKVVQMKSLAMHITNQKLCFDIYGCKFTKYLHGT